MVKLSQAKIRVFDAFNIREDNWTFSDFESALKKSMGARYLNYQTAKGVIKNAYKRDEYLSVVTRYLQSLYDCYGNLPAEFNEMGHLIKK